MSARQGGSPWYVSASEVQRTFTVQPAALQIAAAPATRLFNTPNPTFTGTVNGLVNGDVITATYASSATVATDAVGLTNCYIV